jgi:hypothetical protein
MHGGHFYNMKGKSSQKGKHDHEHGTKAKKVRKVPPGLAGGAFAPGSDTGVTGMGLNLQQLGFVSAIVPGAPPGSMAVPFNNHCRRSIVHHRQVGMVRTVCRLSVGNSKLPVVLPLTFFTFCVIFLPPRVPPVAYLAYATLPSGFCANMLFYIQYFLNLNKMSELVCECSDVMRASCDVDQTNYTVLFVCAVIAWKLWRVQGRRV